MGFLDALKGGIKQAARNYVPNSLNANPYANRERPRADIYQENARAAGSSIRAAQGPGTVQGYADRRAQGIADAFRSGRQTRDEAAQNVASSNAPLSKRDDEDLRNKGLFDDRNDDLKKLAWDWDTPESEWSADQTQAYLDRFKDATLSGEDVKAGDWAGLHASEFLKDHDDWGYGDDWGKFQAEGTYDQWKQALEDEKLKGSFSNITGDDRFQTDGDFDFDKYWNHSNTINPEDYGTMSYDDWKLVNGGSGAQVNSLNAYLANNGWSPDVAMPTDEEYALIANDPTFQAWLESNGDADHSRYTDGANTLGALNRYALQYGMLNGQGDQYDYDDIVRLAGEGDMGQDFRYTKGERGNGSEIKAYNGDWDPYARSVSDLYDAYASAVQGDADRSGEAMAYYDPTFRRYDNSRRS